MKATHAERIFNQALKSSREMLGNGWAHLGEDIRSALIVDKAARIVAGQDESISSEKRAALLCEVIEVTDSYFQQTGN